MSKKLLALYGLKWNPFDPDVPLEALCVTPRLESFLWRVEHLVADGGFAAVQGEIGTGKSVALRLVAHRLSGLRDVVVGVLDRPQSSMADFYRELGHLFGVSLAPHNRWAGAKALRDKWRAHIEAAHFRPVLVIDEAQEMKPQVLSELRLLSSADLDARSLLTVVLAGDQRLGDKLRLPDLLPLQSRLRVRLVAEAAIRDDLLACLAHGLARAGAPSLFPPDLCATLVDHAAGNLRQLMTMANDLLLGAAQREARQIDEKLFFELVAPPPERPRPRPQAAARPAR